MAFEIIFAPEAIRDMKRLRVNLRAEVRDTIERHLRNRPTMISKARVKRLRGVSQPQFRLRVRDVRVFYDVRDNEVHILAIVSKEHVDDWLREVGK